MFRTKTWIPVEIDQKEDVLYSRREDAEEEKARLEEMQPENKYEIEEVTEGKRLLEEVADRIERRKRGERL